MRIVIGSPIRKSHMADMRTAAWIFNQMVRPCHPMMSLKWQESDSDFAELGRNVIIETQLKAEPTAGHFLFIDTDIVPRQYQAIWELYVQGKDIISGVCPIQTLEHGNCMNVRVDKKWLKRSELPKEPFKADEIGAGFLLVSRLALLKIGWPWFRTTFKPFGEDGVVIAEGEDEFFCRRAKEEDLEIWCHPGVVCDHFNYTALPGE